MAARETQQPKVVIEAVKPEIDCGRFPIKRITGDTVTVEADIFADGHDVLSAVLLYRREKARRWKEAALQPLVNDRWRGSFAVSQLGRYRYTITAWIDRFQTWRQDLEKRVAARQDVSVDLQIGARLVADASRRAPARQAAPLHKLADRLNDTKASMSARIRLALSPRTAALMSRCPDRSSATTYHRELAVVVDRPRARFSTWYEMFPRSCAAAGGHGTFRDCEARLGYIAEMGFDVLYLPPIHPIGHTNRKGKNNAVTAGPDDPGTPWAIGAEEGGHKAVHRQLGTLADFRQLVSRARERGIEVALDIAFQCSPDHPYVREHPQWFRRRPDGTIQYAENPPKKYQDIYPLEFDNPDWRGLWQELYSVFLFWIEQGVSIFRVDNPHTKPFPFWEWLIAKIKAAHPEVIFLSEAFTRPRVMYRLAKLGFSQSYTYFAWRNARWELAQYFTELTQTEVREYFRPNLWPNTPDILTEYLQTGGRPAFMARLVLAATLGASYGIYGPAFELGENRPREAGSEEYFNSEKYELKHWALERRDSLRGFISRVNRIRRENPALQGDLSLRFHRVDNEQLICYSKRHAANVILVVVNLDYRNKQAGWVELDLEPLGLKAEQPFQVQDLLNDAAYTWQGRRNYVELDPAVCPAHIFRVRPQALAP